MNIGTMDPNEWYCIMFSKTYLYLMNCTEGYGYGPNMGWKKYEIPSDHAYRSVLNMVPLQFHALLWE